MVTQRIIFEIDLFDHTIKRSLEEIEKTKHADIQEIIDLLYGFDQYIKGLLGIVRKTKSDKIFEINEYFKSINKNIKLIHKSLNIKIKNKEKL
jgi:hypothetical protein